MREHYSIEVNRRGRARTYSNGHDVYIKIIFKDTKVAYYIPVMLPRRDPSLNYYEEIKKGILSEALYTYTDSCAEKLLDENVEKWKEKTLEKIKSDTTKNGEFLRLLINSKQVCSSCQFAPLTNNPQKPIQFLRDSGYVISTHRAIRCDQCNGKRVHYILTPVLTTDKNNYEVVSEALKERICEVFGYTDAYTEMRNPSPKAFIADHKFPEDRWDEKTATNNPDDMSEEEIRAKFQLLSTQTNLHKQRQCASCITSKKRGYPYGIKYYYSGGEEWNAEYPERGADAEKGCVGCGWYDLLKWKESLNEKVSKSEANIKIDGED